MKESKIIADKLTIGYKVGNNKNKELFNSLNFELKSGELTTIMGANGAGKSTLIKTICGIIPPLSGTVKIAGIDLSTISQKDISKHISIVLTERVADGGLTGYDVIALGRYHYTSYFGTLSAEDKKEIEQAIKNIDIEDLRNKQIANMSDGERQKIMIAKSLCQQSDIIILDEPTAFLDIRSRIEIMQLLRNCAKTQNVAILVSSHDLEQAIQYSDNIWVLSKGEGLFCNTTEDTIYNGYIEKIIGHGSNLYMDYNTCAFLPNEENKEKTVSINGECLFLIKNALRRESINIKEDAEIKIKVNKYNDIDVTIEGNTIKITSIKELIEKINN